MKAPAIKKIGEKSFILTSLATGGAFHFARKPTSLTSVKRVNNLVGIWESRSVYIIKNVHNTKNKIKTTPLF